MSSRKFPSETASAADRVAAFLDTFEDAGVYGENVYSLGRIEGDYNLTVSDLRHLVSLARLHEIATDRTVRLEAELTTYREVDRG